MDNKQIAHDLAVAYTVGKQVPVETLVVEYRKNWVFNIYGGYAYKKYITNLP